MPIAAMCATKEAAAAFTDFYYIIVIYDFMIGFFLIGGGLFLMIKYFREYFVMSLRVRRAKRAFRGPICRNCPRTCFFDGS